MNAIVIFAAWILAVIFIIRFFCAVHGWDEDAERSFKNWQRQRRRIRQRDMTGEYHIDV